jgi:hypothetical protein
MPWLQKPYAHRVNGFARNLLTSIFADGSPGAEGEFSASDHAPNIPAVVESRLTDFIQWGDGISS